MAENQQNLSKEDKIMGKRTKRIKVKNQVVEDETIVNDQEPMDELEEELEEESEEKEFFLKRFGRAVWRQRWKVAAGAALIGGTVAGVLIGRNSKSDDEEYSYSNEPLKLTGGHDGDESTNENNDSGDSYEESEIS